MIAICLALSVIFPVSSRADGLMKLKSKVPNWDFYARYHLDLLACAFGQINQSGLVVANSREIRGQISKAAQLTSNTRRRLLPQKPTDACLLSGAGAISSNA
jgi:hypothetical protein